MLGEYLPSRKTFIVFELVTTVFLLIMGDNTPISRVRCVESKYIACVEPPDVNTFDVAKNEFLSLPVIGDIHPSNSDGIIWGYVPPDYDERNSDKEKLLRIITDLRRRVSSLERELISQKLPTSVVEELNRNREHSEIISKFPESTSHSEDTLKVNSVDKNNNADSLRSVSKAKQPISGSESTRPVNNIHSQKTRTSERKDSQNFRISNKSTTAKSGGGVQKKSPVVKSSTTDTTIILINDTDADLRFEVTLRNINQRLVKKWENIIAGSIVMIDVKRDIVWIRVHIKYPNGKSIQKYEYQLEHPQVLTISAKQNEDDTQCCDGDTKSTSNDSQKIEKDSLHCPVLPVEQRALPNETGLQDPVLSQSEEVRSESTVTNKETDDGSSPPPEKELHSSPTVCRLEDTDSKVDDSSIKDDKINLDSKKNDCGGDASRNLKTTDVPSKDKTPSKRNSGANSRRNSDADQRRNSDADQKRNSGANSRRNSDADLRRNSGANSRRNSDADLRRNSGADLRRNSGANSRRNSDADLRRNSGANSRRNSDADLRRNSGANSRRNSDADLRRNSGASPRRIKSREEVREQTERDIEEDLEYRDDNGSGIRVISTPVSGRSSGSSTGSMSPSGFFEIE